MRRYLLAFVTIASLCALCARVDASALGDVESCVVYIGEAEGSVGDTAIRTFCRYLGASLGVLMTPENIAGTRATHRALLRTSRDWDGDIAIGEIIAPNIITDRRNPTTRAGALAWGREIRALCRVVVDPAVVAVRADIASQARSDTLAAPMRRARAIGACGEGSVSDIAARKLISALSSDAVIVRCETPEAAMASLSRGEIDVFASCASDIASAQRSRSIKVVAALDGERSVLFPEAPSARELSADITAGVWRGLCVSSSAPDELVAVIREHAARAAKDPRLAKELRDHGYQLGYLDMEEFEAALDREHESFAPVASSMGWDRR